MKLLLFGSLGIWEILLIVLVVLLLFGAKKIPELMKSMGKGVKNFKEGMNGNETGKEETGKEESHKSEEEK